MEAGYTVKLANPAAIKKYAGLKHSGDETDARHLAQLVRHRSMHILSVESITARQFGARINSNQVKRLALPDIGAMSTR